MADTPIRKRPVSAKRPTRKPARPSRPSPDETPSTNYALRLTEALDEDAPSPAGRSRRGFNAPEDTFSQRLSEALEAISAAQTGESTTPTSPTPKSQGSWWSALDKLPPIRLPIGPPISWRIGLPLLVALVILMGIMSRAGARIESPGVQLPAAPTYPVEQTAPLFTNATPTPEPTPVAAPIGVQDPGGFGFDLMDVGVKLIAVLALAYGSLMLLKRIGVGGASGSSGSAGQPVRVISSIALAPNRSVHVIRVTDGKTFLVGATPNAVNLLAELGETAGT